MKSFRIINFAGIPACSLRKKIIMALTGLLLGGFLLLHAAGNSTIFQGTAAFNAYAEHLRSMELLLPPAGLLLFAVFLLHILTGFSLVLHNRQAKGKKYAISKSNTRLSGWLSRIMPYSGTGVFAFLLLHLLTVRFSDQNITAADRVSQALAEPLLAALHLIGIISLGLHLGHGFWSLMQTFGINYPFWNGLIRGISWLAAAVIIGIFINIILLHVTGMR